jgi:predicted Holliday junction resolvase-like endonuclease
MDETVKWLIVAIVIIVLLVILIVSSLISRFNRTISSQEALIREKDLIIQRNEAEINLHINNKAMGMFEQFKNTEIEGLKKLYGQAAIQEAESLYQQWLITGEKELRKDAVNRSMGVNFGKITEHLLPFSEHLKQFNPRDIRFIGSPIDLIIFDGITAKRNIIDIYIVEIKTGTGQLNKRQRVIRDAIAGNRVKWHPVIVPDFKWDVADDEYE